MGSPISLFRLLIPTTAVLILVTVTAASDSISFSFSNFNKSLHRIKFEGDARPSGSFIQLSNHQSGNFSKGWATYFKPMHLWDNSTGKTADFSTKFSFTVNAQNSSSHVHWLTFFLAPNGSQMPPHICNTSNRAMFISVDSNTFSVSVNSTKSSATVPWRWNKNMNGIQAWVKIRYDSAAGNLCVILAGERGKSDLSFQRRNHSSLYFQVNMSDLLPEWVTFGLYGASLSASDIHKIISWEFASNLQVADSIVKALEVEENTTLGQIRALAAPSPPAPIQATTLGQIRSPPAASSLGPMSFRPALEKIYFPLGKATSERARDLKETYFSLAYSPYSSPPTQSPYSSPPTQSPYSSPPTQSPYSSPPTQSPEIPSSAPSPPSPDQTSPSPQLSPQPPTPPTPTSYFSPPQPPAPASSSGPVSSGLTSPPGPPQPPPAKKGHALIIILSIVAVLLLAIFAATAWFYRSSLSPNTSVVISWFCGSSKEVAPSVTRLAVDKNGKKEKKYGENKLQMDEEFEKLAGPRKFSFNDLAMATDNFSEDRLLGQGGSGKVYVGYLNDMDNKVAIKKIKSQSKHGLKEYAAEVKTVSQLRHRNLVKLLGWCHKEEELLIIYEFMPEGGLDLHLFKEGNPLTWEVRYKICQDVASAILYLHEEWSQCVIHRDIKCSNIMLDSNFQAKLADFGLARFTNHGQGPKTTMLAGTMGYIAPESVYTGQTTKESDVYSFGIVVLEIACGRRVVDKGLVPLVPYMWQLHEAGRLMDAVDPKLEGVYDRREMECTMILGMWCVHPDHNLRPTIRDAVAVLKFLTTLPPLPSKMPIIEYGNLLRATVSPPSTSSFTLNSEDEYSDTTRSSTMFSSSQASNSSPVALLHNAH